MDKSFYIHNWGCQMNVYDGERLSDVLEAAGFRKTDAVASAAYVFLNGCHVREKATEKLYSEIGRLLAQARGLGRPRPRLIVLGCTAQAEGEALRARAPAVDLVIGPQQYHLLPEKLEALEHARLGPDSASRMALAFEPIAKFDALPVRKHLSSRTHAWLTIQEGCDKFCSFCVVPYTRGPEYARPGRAILAEARHLLDGGIREITLLGQNVNAWRGASAGRTAGTWHFGELCAFLIEALPRLHRLRYTTSHPVDIEPSLIRAHRDYPEKLAPFLHLPVQTGSDRLLRAMNRRHSVAFYLEKIQQLREAQPAMRFSSDFIVAFPGEQDQDYADTLRLIRAVDFVDGYSFLYSPRPGTPAYDGEGAAVPPALARERLKGLQGLLRAHETRFSQSQIGLTHRVVVEKAGTRSETSRETSREKTSEIQLKGRTQWGQYLHFEGSRTQIGQIVPVRVSGVTTHGLIGVQTAPTPRDPKRQHTGNGVIERTQPQSARC